MSRLHRGFEAPTVFVVDPDPATNELTRELLDGSELRQEFFLNGREFLAAYEESRPGCVVLELRIPDISGLQIQHRLAASGAVIPLIFVTASPDVSTAVELMRRGAVHVMEKPARPVELLSAIQEAIHLDEERRRTRTHQTAIKNRTAALSPKERVVLGLIAAGKSAKGIAAELALSVRAVELRRASLMKKLEVSSPLELMRFSVLAHQDCEPLLATDWAGAPAYA